MHSAAALIKGKADFCLADWFSERHAGRSLRINVRLNRREGDLSFRIPFRNSDYILVGATISRPPVANLQDVFRAITDRPYDVDYKITQNLALPMGELSALAD